MMSTSIDNEKLGKRMSAFYVMTRILLLGIATVIWAVAPLVFYGVPALPGMAWALSVLYMVVLWLFCSVFDCFDAGHARIRELSAWFCLALFFTDLLLWVTKLIIVEPVSSIFFQLCVWVAQSFVGMLLMFALTRAYYKVYPVRHVCAIISGTDYEKRALAKIAMLTERFSVDEVLSQDGLGLADVPALAPSCNTIFIGDVRHELRQALIEDSYERGRMTAFLPTAADAIYSGIKATQVSDTLLFTNSNIGLTPEQRFFKRIVDIVGALVGIVVSAIPMAVCAIIIKATDGGTVFYRQKRLTRDGEVFELIKLRSMRMNAEKDGVQFSAAHDTRVTPIGRFMRKCRLDEAPQFFNVLAGDVSLVGPRAERPEISKLYAETHPSFEYRLKVKAGLTGYAQINGRYNTVLEDKLLMDLYYIEHWSLVGDIALMLETFKILVSPDSTAGYDEGRISELYKLDVAFGEDTSQSSERDASTEDNPFGSQADTQNESLPCASW